MTVRLSTGLANAMAQGLGFAGALHRGYIKFFSGAQPANADAAETGTLLGIATKSSGALTKETRASATLIVTGTSGTLTAVTAGTLPIVGDPGEVTYLTSTAVTAALIADAINRSGVAEATSASNVVTVKPRPGFGAAWNTLALAAAGITCTGSNFSGGVAPVNALMFGQPSAGVIAKPSDQVWSFNGLATGTIGWARYYPSDTNDSGALLSGAPWYPRLDGSCGVGSGDFQLSTISISAGLPVTIDTFQWTQPKS